MINELNELAVNAGAIFHSSQNLAAAGRSFEGYSIPPEKREE